MDRITAIPKINSQVIERMFSNPNQAEVAQHKLVELQSSEEVARIAERLESSTDKESNESVFVYGWRPTIGWVCGGALACKFIILPLAAIVAMLMGHSYPEMSDLDTNLWQLMIAMLGMSGLRTIEKKLK